MAEIKEYTPTPPKSNIPPSTYELVSSVTGKKTQPITIGSGNLKFQVPHSPKSNCKKCIGKGYVGIDSKKNQMFICHKCYPNIK